MAKTILVVAMPDSIHTARWLKQFNTETFNIHFFPSILAALHPELNLDKVYVVKKPYQQPFLKLIQRMGFALLRRFLSRFLPLWQAKQLAKLIEHLKPDLIHALEIQHAGYLTLTAKAFLKTPFPPWLMTNWGSDIYWFARFPEHETKIKAVLANCDYYSCECQRDVELARQLGFTGLVLPVMPNTGGFDLKYLQAIREQIKPSQRKLILLKGYQHWAGRALIALEALSLCREQLLGYSVAIYSANASVVKAAEVFSKTTQIAVQIIPPSSHDTILHYQAQARIAIGLSISDAISTALLEAMVMGAFPIQSCTACADEWLEHGVGGFIVPPEEVDIVAMFIKKALLDDLLVDHAACVNWQTALDRLDTQQLTQQALAYYQSLVSA